MSQRFSNPLGINSFVIPKPVDYAKALKCAILSQEIYQNFDQIQFSNFPDATPELFEHRRTDTQCTILSDDRDDSIYIVFHGRNSQINRDNNFNFEQGVVEFERTIIHDQIIQNQQLIYSYEQESSSRVRMHQGFSECYLSIRPQIHNYLQRHNVSSVTVTGHGLGGALTTLCAIDIQYNFYKRVTIEVYTFGAPRVGNDSFRKSFNYRVPNSYRFVYGMDIVPALPRVWQGYRHVDVEHRLGERFSLNFGSQRFKDHAIANYVTALSTRQRL
jgi:triacylglycerol lipase